MEDLFSSLTEELAAWVRTVTGAPVAGSDFRLPREEGQLSLGAFVRGGAEEAVGQLAGALPACPSVRAVKEKNGWLLFFLSDAWFDGLIRWARELDVRPGGSYLENRMSILARKGDGPCPDAEPVRRALWGAYLAHRRGVWREADERLILAMTHHLTGMDRVELENYCGGVAAAIIEFKGAKP